MAEVRELRFQGLDQVMPEVRRLLAGHETVGNWSLGQILRHLATSLRLTARAVAPEGPPREFSPRWEARRRRLFESGQAPKHVEVPLPILLPPPGLDERAEADELAAAIAEYQDSDAPPPMHPVFGPFTRDDWALFHAMHCAHHLAFALPTPTPTPSPTSPTGGPPP